MSLKWLWIAAFVASGGPVFADDVPRQIVVTGEGRIDAAPDLATVTLGVSSDAESARQAIDANSTAMAAVLANLKAAGIADRDLQTSNFSVSPRFDYSRSNGTGEIVGFVAQNTLSVRVRDLSGLGDILDAVADEGANTFQGLSFGLQEPGPVEDEARKAAVAEARRKAVLYAEAAGVTLGPLMTLSEQGGMVPQPKMMTMQMERAASDAVPIASGELTITSTVTLVYGIAE